MLPPFLHEIRPRDGARRWVWSRIMSLGRDAPVATPSLGRDAPVATPSLGRSSPSVVTRIATVGRSEAPTVGRIRWPNGTSSYDRPRPQFLTPSGSIRHHRSRGDERGNHVHIPARLPRLSGTSDRMHRRRPREGTDGRSDRRRITPSG